MHLSRSVTLLSLSLLLSGYTLAFHNSGPRLRPWQRVRVTAPAAGLDRKREFFFAVRGDSVVFVRVESRGQFAGYRMADTIPWSVPFDAVTRLEVPTISWSRAVGGIGGYAVGWVIVRRLKCEGLDRMFECLAQGMFIPVFFGAFGAAIGEVMVPDAGWRQVPLSSLRVGLAPLPGGRLGFGASVGFWR